MKCEGPCLKVIFRAAQENAINLAVYNAEKGDIDVALGHRRLANQYGSIVKRIENTGSCNGTGLCGVVVVQP